ncbi:hypothetical protein FOL47_006238 [Perkinsus chesapeaki]|uniref:Uncharacterized protein n=1 Tax=Perkinsus chesapeaki TaxID=330153 RepID=A0A7J6LT12_PERCH|nr:hypothetical protein FOL47_006238 [Perkinsus chesapeaki]
MPAVYLCMKLHLCTVSSALFVLSVTGDILYRNYEKGDYCDNALFSECEEELRIPCYTAVNLSKGHHAVVGFITMTVPDDSLPPEEQSAVKGMMPPPKKEGSLGFIDYVRNGEIAQTAYKRQIEHSKAIGGFLYKPTASVL